MATIVQSRASGELALTSSPVAFSFTSALTANHTIVVVIVRVNPAESKTFTCTHNADSAALTQAVMAQHTNIDAQSVIFYRHNAPITSNAISIGVSPVSASGWIRVAIFEVAGLAVSAPSTGSNANEGTVTSHVDSTTALSGTGFIATASSLGNFRIHTAGSGYTLILPSVGASEATFAQYQVGTVTSNQGPHTHDSTAVRGTGVMALFADAPSAPGAITDLSATAVSSTQVNLTWTAASGATSHRVERATVP